MEIKNILVIRFRRVGDSVLSMAMCHSLRETFPSATIDFVINKGIHTLYENHPDVDHVITFDNEENHNILKYICKVWNVMHETHYDVIIDMRGTIKTLWFSLFSLSTPFRIGAKKYYGKGVLNYFVDNHNNLHNRVKQNNMFLDPLRKIVELKLSEDFKLYVTAEQKTIFHKYMESKGVNFLKPVMLVTPTTRIESKAWPKEYMIEVLQKIITKYDIQIVFNYSGDTERKCAMHYHQLLNLDSHIFTSIEANSLLDLCALASNCDFFFGNEGGPRHIAQALGIPTCSIFPPGIRKSLWLPNECKSNIGIGIEDVLNQSNINMDGLSCQEKMQLIDVESVWNMLDDFVSYVLSTKISKI